MKTLFLRKMGMDNNELSDIKNYRVRVIDWINTRLAKEPIFFEFTHCDMHKMRYTNKRTGKQLKKPIWESIQPHGLHIDTEIEKENGSYRVSDIEKNVWDMYLEYNTTNILKVVNMYAIEKYSKVVFIEEAAIDIINKIGGYREKSILECDPVFSLNDTTWNDSYKCVKVYSRKNHKLDDFCIVDILNNKIVG